MRVRQRKVTPFVNVIHAHIFPYLTYVPKHLQDVGFRYANVHKNVHLSMILYWTTVYRWYNKATNTYITRKNVLVCKIEHIVILKSEKL